MLIMYSSVVTFDKLHNGITPFFKPNGGVKQAKDIPSLFTNSCQTWRHGPELFTLRG